MKFHHYGIFLGLFVLITCTPKHSTDPVSVFPEGYIAPGSYIIRSNFYSTARSTQSEIDNILNIYSTRCEYIRGVKVDLLNVESRFYSTSTDTLTIELLRHLGLGPELKDTATVFGVFSRVSPDTGIYGVWKLSKRTFTSPELTAEDTLLVTGYNPGIVWMDISSNKLDRYYNSDSLPSFAAEFVIKHKNFISSSHTITCDTGISGKTVYLFGQTSKDTLNITIDDHGTTMYFITLSNESKAVFFQPNPYRYNPDSTEITVSNPTPCEEYPGWINRFLGENQKTAIPEEE